MARPSKNNAEYFSHDANMRNDMKVKALRSKFSHKGYAVWCFFLETLTDTDFFEIDFDDVNKELLAADFDVTVSELIDIVQYCEKIGLLQMTEGNRLYSVTHQRRFSGLLMKREHDRERLANLKNKKKTSNTDVFTAKTRDNNNNHGDNTYSKVKKSKEEESKVNIKYPYQDICELWNCVCVSLPKVAKLNDGRKQKIRCRLDEFDVKPEEFLSTCETLFQRVQASDFLTGRRTGNREWHASFDWFFSNSSNWVKVSEGNYDNRGTQTSPQTGAISQGVQLGVGEFFDGSGRRTYGSGRATIPVTAPPRPSEKYQWSEETKTWIML